MAESFLDNLLKPVRDWLDSMGLKGDPVDTRELFLNEIETYYSEIESLMKEIPDSFYKADGGYSKFKTKKEFLEHAWHLLWVSEQDLPGTSLFSNSKDLERMRDYAKKLWEKWKKAQQQTVMHAVESGVVTVPGIQPSTDVSNTNANNTTPIAEDQSKTQQPPQSTNYMSYGFIALIAVLVIVIIIVLRRK
jgi:hypothetical protein